MPEPTDKIAPAEESKQQQPAAPAEPAEGKEPAADKKEETVGEVLETANEPKPSKDEEESVPLSKYLETKNANKALSKRVKDLEKSIEDGASDKEISLDINAIAEEHDVNPKFLKDLVKAIRAEASAEAEGKIDSKLKPLHEKERAEKINAAFKAGYSKAMESMPEYEGVVKEDVIKSLSLLPQNANKTFTQLIEETFGHLIQGKRTMDSGSSRAGKNDDGDVDTARAQKDPEYFKQVMANPVLKKKYNDALTNRLASQL